MSQPVPGTSRSTRSTVKRTLPVDDLDIISRSTSTETCLMEDWMVNSLLLIPNCDVSRSNSSQSVYKISCSIRNSHRQRMTRVTTHPALLPQLDRNVNSGETAKWIEMKLGRQVVVGHCQIVLAWDPSAHAPGQFPWAPFTRLLVDFCHSSNHLSRTFWIINIRLKYFPNSDRRLSFLRSCISFLISSLSKMALSTWHNATLFRRIWPQVGRVNDFNLRRYHHWTTAETYKKLSYRRGTARCVVSVEILPIATQLCRNYLYDKSWTNFVSPQCRNCSRWQF